MEWALGRIKGKALISLILRIAWKAYIYIYHVWRERNRRIHGHSSASELQILEEIKEEVRIKLTGIQSIAADSGVNRSLCSKWGLSTDIFS